MLAQKENPVEPEEIGQIFAAHKEWVLARGENHFALQSDEIEISALNGRLILSCLTERGWQSWAVLNWKSEGGKLIFKTARKLKNEATTLEFVPRISSAELREDINAARLLRAHEIGGVALKAFSSSAKIEKLSLNQSNRGGFSGTIAHILLAKSNGKRVAACAPVTENFDAGNFLSHTLLWFSKLTARRPAEGLWLIVDEKFAEELRRLHALLRDGWQTVVRIWSFENKDEAALEFNQKSQISDLKSQIERLKEIKALAFADLWREKPKKISPVGETESSRAALEILKLAPEKIDIVRSHKGETLRFHGLPFARVRKVFDEEKVWFGVEGKRRRILDETTLADFDDLLGQLNSHRQAETKDTRDFLYRGASEAWLESLLRRDVSRLDPNLILAPLYAQFRFQPKSGSLDLLALRTDGRIVVIELKTTTDRQHLFQAVSYWREVELLRRSGNLQKAQLFGEAKIADVPALVYLVAPLMSFHRELETLAQVVNPQIEIWRFDLNEDWRGGIKIARRTRL